jgi:hypothetical protein
MRDIFWRFDLMIIDDYALRMRNVSYSNAINVLLTVMALVANSSALLV